MCNNGAIGEGCNTSDVCEEGLDCITFIDVEGIVEIATCGECTMDNECEAGEQCAPQIDVAAFSGQYSCVADGSVEAGQGCDHMGAGEECEDGLVCAAIDIMGLLTFGICAECATDGDCTDNQNGSTCLSADVDLEAGEVIPPVCGTPQ
jgi:hypothetical protein